LANDKQYSRILALLDGAYGFKELSVKSKFTTMYEKHLRKMCRLLSDDKGAATHKKIPVHEHVIEYCKKIGCDYWEREVTSKVYPKTKKNISYMD